MIHSITIFWSIPQDRIGELLDEAEKHTDDMVTLRATTTTLDREKDALQAALDERAERIASMEDQLSRREREIAELRNSVSNLEVKILALSVFSRSKKLKNKKL